MRRFAPGLKKSAFSAVNKGMGALKYLVSLWVTVFLYTVLTLLNGPGGFSAYDQLKTEQDKLAANLESLETTRQELAGIQNALENDSDAIAVRARELGYGRETERFVRIVGLGRPMRHQYSPGQILSVHEPEFMADATIRLIALIAGGITLAFLYIIQILRMLI
jgi:cell division protein FtsB